ncbi:MAG: hypothetical protein EZS28_050736 [Streblomastix strix]|uniref:Uncharacterized protein n=1 Tax=Streblomastix strix TaxID=222440 RepID=A0A5J4T672_9EUKA|nr:MAG: hypothetical protein EZS28_050736 [Streblomastix strix]
MRIGGGISWTSEFDKKGVPDFDNQQNQILKQTYSPLSPRSIQMNFTSSTSMASTSKQSKEENQYIRGVWNGGKKIGINSNPRRKIECEMGDEQFMRIGADKALLAEIEQDHGQMWVGLNYAQSFYC